MLTTRRYEYCRTDQIRIHPSIGNHRALSESKVAHLTKDIVANGLLEKFVHGRVPMKARRHRRNSQGHCYDADRSATLTEIKPECSVDSETS